MNVVDKHPHCIRYIHDIAFDLVHVCVLKLKKENNILCSVMNFV